jgi:hypothetical protein
VDVDRLAVGGTCLDDVLTDPLDLEEPSLAKRILQLLLLTELLLVLLAEALLVLLAETLLVLLPKALLVLLAEALLVLLTEALLVLLAETLLVLLAETLLVLLPKALLVLLAETLLVLLPKALLVLLTKALLVLLLTNLNPRVVVHVVELRLALFCELLRTRDPPVLHLCDHTLSLDRDAVQREQINAGAVATLDLDVTLILALENARNCTDLLPLLIYDLPVEKVGNGHLPKLAHLLTGLLLTRLLLALLHRLPGLPILLTLLLIALREGCRSCAEHQGCGDCGNRFACHDALHHSCCTGIVKPPDHASSLQ